MRFVGCVCVDGNLTFVSVLFVLFLLVQCGSGLRHCPIYCANRVLGSVRSKEFMQLLSRWYDTAFPYTTLHSCEHQPYCHFRRSQNTGRPSESTPQRGADLAVMWQRLSYRSESTLSTTKANVTEIYASEQTRGTKGAESQCSAVVGMGFLLVQDHLYSLPHGQRTSNATDRDV